MVNLIVDAQVKAYQRKTTSRNILSYIIVTCLLCLLFIALPFIIKAETLISDKLVSSIITIESNGNPNAVSPQGCIGLMQINPNGALKEYNQYSTRGDQPTGNPEDCKYHKKTDLFCAEVNVKIGTWYLNRLANHYINKLPINCLHWNNYPNGKGFDRELSPTLKKYFVENEDELRLMLICSAYNGGITRLRKCNYDINCMPKETQNYVRKVMKIYKSK